MHTWKIQLPDGNILCFEMKMAGQVSVLLFIQWSSICSQNWFQKPWGREHNGKNGMKKKVVCLIYRRPINRIMSGFPSKWVVTQLR